MSILTEPGRFLTGSTMGHVIRMAMTGMVGFVFIFLVDALNLYWLARAGETRMVAAAGFAFVVQFMSVATCIGMMVASTAVISKTIGAGEADLARRQTTSTAVIAFVLQMAIAGLFCVFRHDILAMLRAEGETAEMAARYLLMTLPSLPLMGAAMVLNGALRAEGDARRSVAVTLGGGIVSLGLDPLLILGMGMGLEGAAISVGIKRLVLLLLAFRFTRKIHNMLARPDAGDIRRTLVPFLAIAVPAILSQLARPVGNYVLTMEVAQFGDEALAGWAVLSRVMLVAFGGLFALAAAIGGIFGQNLGAGAFDRVRSTYRDSILFGVVYVLIIWAGLWLLTDWIIAFFAVTGPGADLIVAFTHIGAVSFALGTGLFVANAAFNALGRPLWATAVNWLRDGALTWPIAVAMIGAFGAVGAVYSLVAVSLVAGTLAGALGFWYVRRLGPDHLPPKSTLPVLDP